MSRLTKPAFVIVLSAVLLGVAGFVYVRRRNRLARLTAEAPAQVLSVSVDTDRTRSKSGSRTRHKTRIAYRYTVNGAALTGETSKSGDVKSSYEGGRPLKACYEPGHPENAEIFTADYECGG
jgi:hypothetical protein